MDNLCANKMTKNKEVVQICNVCILALGYQKNYLKPCLPFLQYT